MTVDPNVPAPDCILAIRAISHQGTLCEVVSECGKCGGMTECATKDVGGKAMPVVFSSKGKHGTYAEKDACNGFAGCFDACELADASAAPPLLNAGEPT